ncbi:hypothetical protein [Photobacterium damselae]|uniref:hypothetical protein n=1 Tax=Photobacterium damselae TaxID=38293 RepID=UPI0002F21270|nr:hypothetical protein [Photobacterium damselae]OLQ80026.1 hypothetical protein BEI67_13850 [Photobacterium damselae subsp. piscicida]PSB91259.1 hypothetical protein C5F64_01230 [Photobacterium damselae subsp. damselae]TJZ89825.1 hypothetical protein FA893_11785 [Photobacterium damselae subsp. piscicida]BBC41102.1 hypothetical protein PDPE_1-01942 [Photobacterium damselae subsp. piscicida]
MISSDREIKKQTKIQLGDFTLQLFLHGKKLSKAEINSLIPKGITLSAEDIIAEIRSRRIAISVKLKALPCGGSIWYMKVNDRNSYIQNPKHHKYDTQYKQAIQSQENAARRIHSIKETYGTEFIFEQLVQVI